ncbi:MAG: YggT family protein [Atopobiaceae bacterium]|nr:YggT family protein [Atopobiaceae bacterium]
MRLMDFYQILIVVWCILSWLPVPREGILADLVGAIDALVSPYINLFRRFIPPFGGLDFTPILAMLVLQVAERAIIGILL